MLPPTEGRADPMSGPQQSDPHPADGAASVGGEFGQPSGQGPPARWIQQPPIDRLGVRPTVAQSLEYCGPLDAASPVLLSAHFPGVSNASPRRSSRAVMPRRLTATRATASTVDICSFMLCSPRTPTARPVPATVDERDSLTAGQARPGEPEVDGQSAAALLGIPIQLHTSQCADQSGLPVIDVSGSG